MKIIATDRKGAEHIVELAVTGTNSIGEHVAATVRMALP